MGQYLRQQWPLIRRPLKPCCPITRLVLICLHLFVYMYFFLFTQFYQFLLTYFFQDKDGCGSGNDGDDEEEYGLHKKNFYKNSMLGHGYMGPPPGSLQMPPSYRPPPPYGGGMPPTCNRQGGMSNPMLSLSSCPCCGEVQLPRNFIFNFCYLAQF